MPEIPEMEIYKDYLNKWVKDKQINVVNVLRVKCVNLESAEFCRSVIGKRIKDITRSGKYLIFHLDDSHFLLTHMMLDGRLFLLPLKDLDKDPSNKAFMSEVVNSGAEELRERIKELPGKPSAIFGLSDDSVLFFCSLTFGYLHYLSKDELEGKLGVLGSDPLDPSFNAQGLFNYLKGRRGWLNPGL